MDCSEVLEQLGDYVDKQTRAELCKAIEEHLAQCRDCRLEVDTVHRTIVLYQADEAERDIPIPAGLAARLEAALSRAYGEPPERPTD